MTTIFTYANVYDMRRFVVADLHFKHSKIITYNNRPFKNVKEMDEELIKLWNSTVGKKDIVYILGDFTLVGQLDIIAEYLNALNGTKVLVKGNHDVRKPKEYLECGFYEVSSKPMMVEPGVILMHEPFKNLSFIEPNYIYFFGHVHNNRVEMDRYPNCMCVSVERIDYRPINLDSCITIMRTRKLR